MGMKQLLLICAVVALVGCGKEAKEKAAKIKAAADARAVAEKKATETATIPQQPKTTSEKLITDPIVEKAVRGKLEKPEGEITESDLEKVRYLSLAFQKITDVSLKDVAKLKNIESLNLSRTQITDAGLMEVAKLQKIEQLIMTQCTKTTDTGLKDVAKLQSLKKLFLERTKITDAGLKEVAKLRKLRSLGLNGTQITDTGVAELKKVLPNCKIYGP